jgi:FkbM family methyltransferase
MKCIIAKNKYGEYSIPEFMTSLGRFGNDAGRIVHEGGVYESETIRFMISNCEQGDIIHAGTSFGSFLPAISNSCSGLIWAFEPSPMLFKCAQDTIRLNGLKNIKINNIGLSDKPDNAWIRSLAPCPAVFSNEKYGKLPPDRKPEFESIKIDTIDNLIPQDRHVSILQLDIEKGEEPAIRGALKLIKRCFPILIIESLGKGPSGKPQRMPDILLKNGWYQKNIFNLGYTYAGSVHANVVLKKDDKPQA